MTSLKMMIIWFLQLPSLLVLHLVTFSGGGGFSVSKTVDAAGEGRRRAPYTEEERRAKYIERNHTFPFPEYTPNTEGWKQIIDQRFAQVCALKDTQMKWDGWIQTITTAVTMPNFTEFGWGLTQAPRDLTEEIQKGIADGLANGFNKPRGFRSEGKIDVIDGPLPPWFISRPDLTKKALTQLKPILEAWAGIPLTPAIAYGFRLYRNESSLWMHIDRTQTHVISCIYHIDSSDNAEPWPIVIEDYAGNTNSVILKPGDILLYESAKNFHGRPTKFYGDWYTSLFVHFYPSDPEWKRENHDLDSHYAIPPNWRDIDVPDEISAKNNDYPNLKVVGTSMLEPDCPDKWCNLSGPRAVESEGPGTFGYVLTAGGKNYSLARKNLLGDGEEDEEL
mmetsp:Transcript_24209/g.57271  ORF Transcript_24209/g.57271 Transcript_24209/m.57271 type:complete len:391 (-) Transcript_24209:2842-4014(-)